MNALADSVRDTLTRENNLRYQFYPFILSIFLYFLFCFVCFFSLFYRIVDLKIVTSLTAQHYTCNLTIV